MNILMINKTDRRGGAAKIAWDLKTELTRRGHKVNFLVADKTTDDAHVLALSGSKFLFYLSHLLGTDISLFRTDYILDTKEFKQADIVLCHNLHGHYFNLKTLVKMSRQKPVVWLLHDLWAMTAYCSQAPGQQLRHGFYDCAINSSRSLMKYFNQAYLRARKRRLYRHLKINLVVPSVWLKQRLNKTVLADKPVSLIHHGLSLIDFPTETKTVLRQKLNLPLDKKIVLFVASGGKDNLWKGWNYAVQVMTHFTNRTDVLFLCIGGRGEPSAPANLRFVDYIDEVLLKQYFQAADAFLLTSVAESFALVVLEAMAAGLPVVSFPVGVVDEVIQHQINGYVANNSDSQALAVGLTEVLNFDQAKLSALKIANRQLISQEFSLELMVKKYEALFQSLIKS